MMSFRSENLPSAAQLPSAAAELKAKLLRSAKKLQENKPIPMQPSIYREENRLRVAIGAMTPRTQAQVDNAMENNIRRAIETQAKVVRELCTQGLLEEARISLGGLRRVAPEVIELCEFWETAMFIEKDDHSRAATCMLLALENVRKSSERDALIPILSSFLEKVAQPHQRESVDAFFFPTGRRLSFQLPLASASPKADVSPIKYYVVPEEDISPRQREASPIIAKSHTTMGQNAETPKQIRSVSFASAVDAISVDEPKTIATSNETTFSLRGLLSELPPMKAALQVPPTECPIVESPDSASPQEPKRTFRSTPFPKRFRETDSFISVLGSPAVRIPTPRKVVSAGDHVFGASRPTPRLESRSPARARLYEVELEHENKGMIVVLSPIKQSSSSTKRVATPVRRSLRVATVTTAEKNKDALQRSEYSYVPNDALLPIPAQSPQLSTRDQDEPDGVRRSARKAKLVEKLSPRFGTKVYN